MSGSLNRTNIEVAEDSGATGEVLERGWDVQQPAESPARLMATHARTFTFATWFFSPQRRRTIRRLYAFFRTLDDLVDVEAQRHGKHEAVREELESWREWLLTGSNGLAPRNHIGAELSDEIKRYRIPTRSLVDFVRGVESDLDRKSIKKFDELERYCYQVASTVGITLCYVFRSASVEALAAARSLGIAMQLTNVVRDVGGDLRLGRVYLPEDELQRFGISKADIHRMASPGADIDDRYRRLMRFQIERANAYYHAGIAGVALLPLDCRVPILSAARLYQRILRAVERNDYDSLHKRAFTTGMEKLQVAAGSSLQVAGDTVFRNGGHPNGRKT